LTFNKAYQMSIDAAICFHIDKQTGRLAASPKSAITPELASAISKTKNRFLEMLSIATQADEAGIDWIYFLPPYTSSVEEGLEQLVLQIGKRKVMNNG